MVPLRPPHVLPPTNRSCRGALIMSAPRRSHLITFLLLAVSSFALASCAAERPDTCAPGLYEYEGTCLDKVSQNFVGCTATRGNDLTVEDKQKFDASVDLGIKGASGVVEISKKVVETELPDVAIEIVRICLELSKALANPVEQIEIGEQVDALQAMLDSISEGTISLSPDRGPYDQEISVSGTDWPANVEVEVSAGTSRVRTTTAADGSFQTTINLDPRFESVSPPSIEIRVSPVSASTQLPASALYEIVK
jgi:hypothetical protein